MASSGIGLYAGGNPKEEELDEDELEVDHVFMEEYRTQRLKGDTEP